MEALRYPKFVVYKGKGALQLEFTPASTAQVDSNGNIEKGFAMLSIAPSRKDAQGNTAKDSRGNPIQNWEEKIMMKMNDKDLADIYLALLGKKETKIIHDPNAGTGEAKQIKSLSIQPGQKGGMFFSMYFQEKNASVILDDNESIRLRLLIMATLPAIYGWDRALI